MDHKQKSFDFGFDYDSDSITLDLSSIDDLLTKTASGITISNATAAPTFGITGSGSTGGYVFTSTGTNAAAWQHNTLSIDDSFRLDPPSSGKLTITGENADIDINGVSLMETLRQLKEQLNVLTPDPAMEQEWDELRELRQQYEAKLEACREKSRMWNTLKQMPPPPKP